MIPLPQQHIATASQATTELKRNRKMNPGLSLYLDMLRALAAVAVYVFHAKYFSGKAIPWVGQLGSEAVIVFFVLSGLLISFARTKHPDMRDFMVARLARLWSVALPALALTLVSDTVGQYLSLAAYSPMQPYNWFKWVASLIANTTFLNQVWNLQIYPGTNAPFWSLSYEFWYYAIFAAAVYLHGWSRVVGMGLLALVAGPKILVGLPIWLMGACVYWALQHLPKCSPRSGFVIWLASLGLAFAFWYFRVYDLLVAHFPAVAQTAAKQWRINFWPESYLIGAIVSANIYGFACFAGKAYVLLGPLAVAIKALASISFGLYLFHYPLMYLVKSSLWSLGVFEGNLFVATIYLLPFGLSAYFALVCERHKGHFARVLGAVSSRLGRVERVLPTPR